MFTKSSPRSSSRSAFQSCSKEKIERGWIRRSTSCRVCGNSYKLIVEGLRIRVLEKERPRMLSPVVSVCWCLRRKTAGSILNNNLLGDSIFWWLFCVCHIKARVDNRKKNSYRKVWGVMNGSTRSWQSDMSLPGDYVWPWDGPRESSRLTEGARGLLWSFYLELIFRSFSAEAEFWGAVGWQCSFSSSTSWCSSCCCSSWSTARGWRLKLWWGHSLGWAKIQISEIYVYKDL